MQEIENRTPLIMAVQEAGQNLVRGRHFASHEISERLAKLKKNFDTLKKESTNKDRLLQQALKIQTFLSEVCLAVQSNVIHICILYIYIYKI